MTSLLALGAAAFYGAADFLGGIATRRATTIATVLTTQGAGLLMLLLCTPLMLDHRLGGATSPTARWPGSPAASVWRCCTRPWRSAR